MASVCNGKSEPGPPITQDQTSAMRSHIEDALTLMTVTLTTLGFSEHEALSVSMATRTAITDIIKERRRGS
jgi:hypothetical protein